MSAKITSSVALLDAMTSARSEWIAGPNGEKLDELLESLGVDPHAFISLMVGWSAKRMAVAYEHISKPMEPEVRAAALELLEDCGPELEQYGVTELDELVRVLDGTYLFVDAFLLGATLGMAKAKAEGDAE